MPERQRTPMSLKARALQWLAQREHSRVELRRKLLAAAQRQRARESLAPAAHSDLSEPVVVEENSVLSDHDHRETLAREVDSLLDALAAQRLLSETRFVESRVHARAARFGNRRIEHELAQHGLTLDVNTINELNESERTRAREVWLRKFGPTPARSAPERARQMRFLAGRGFSSDTIRAVVQSSEDDE